MKVEEIKKKKRSIKQYLFKIIPHLSDMINDHKATIKLKTNKSQEWKIQLGMHVNFISSKDTGETRTVYVWSDNKEIMWGKKSK